VRIRGEVQNDGEPCSRVRVDVYLRDVKAGVTVSVGAFATDEGGRFAGALIVPTNATVGEYDIAARTKGGSGCAEGTSE
jgi:5-hydroxyisourate hydrolase-like protein (transthyretin family)